MEENKNNLEASSTELVNVVNESKEVTMIEKDPQNAERITTLIAQIDMQNPSLSISYGAATMSAISQFADGLLEQVRAKNAGVVGEQLTDLMLKVKGIDIDALNQKPSFLSRLPLIGSLFNKVERSIAEYKTLSEQVDVVSSKLDEAMVGLLRDIETLEQLYIRNREFYQDISLHIAAGKEKLKEVEATELPRLKAEADASGDVMEAQRVKDMVSRIQRFERRLHDLELSRTIAYQTAPQIRLIQSNNQTLAEKIQSSILSTIPIWKSQMVLALSLNSQRNAAKLQKNVADTTNELLRKNAEMLEVSSIETAREVERSIVDIETLRDVQGRLIHTIEETANIAKEARTRRVSVEKELVTMEKDLRDRLASIAATR